MSYCTKLSNLIITFACQIEREKKQTYLLLLPADMCYSFVCREENYSAGSTTFREWRFGVYFYCMKTQ